MKLFKIDFGLKDRYRRGLAQGARTTRSPQTESSASINERPHEHDPHHQATSPSSPSVLFSAGSSSQKANEPMEQWSQFGYSLEASIASDNDQIAQNSQVEGYAVTMAHPLSPRVGENGRHDGQEYNNNEEGYDHENSNSLATSSTMALPSAVSGSSASTSFTLSPSSYSSDESDSDSDDYYSDSDEEEEASREGDDPDHSEENDLLGFSYSDSRSKNYYDYYGGERNENEHGGYLPPAPIPAIEPTSNRDELEHEARQRRLERHIDKRRQSLNGNQPAPSPRRKKRKKAKDLRKQVLLKNAQHLLD
ncbi:hypothetical protein BGZ76_008466 [Entomortierella beljakovae]|nr:hypothetical protein BGZ76_008466 [Entomortierella beljakovae]